MGREILLKLGEGPGEGRGNFVSLYLHPDVARKSDQSHDGTISIQNWQLCRQAPDRVVGPMPLHFEVVHQRAAGAQNFLVLLGGNAAKVTGADIARAFAKDLRLALQAVPGHQGLVHGYVPAGRVLHEKRDIGRAVEKPFKQADFHLRDLPREGRIRILCARIHSSMRF